MIAIVDDDEDWLALLGHHLEAAGLGVVRAVRSSKELWELIKLDVPRLVVIDVNIPGDPLNGVDMAAALKLYRSPTPISVVVCTGSNDVADMEDSLRLASDFVSKDADPREIVARCRAAMLRSR